ncbi:MAG: hypothetical protein ACJAYR_003619 [Sneathiella sp.]|jgi:hypothetical protein
MKRKECDRSEICFWIVIQKIFTPGKQIQQRLKPLDLQTTHFLSPQPVAPW